MTASTFRKIIALALACGILCCLTFMGPARIAKAGLGVSALSTQSTNDAAGTEDALGEPWTLQANCSVCHPVEATSKQGVTGTELDSSSGTPADISKAAAESDLGKTDSIGSSRDTDAAGATAAKPDESEEMLLAERHEALGLACNSCHKDADMQTVHKGMTADPSCAPRTKLTQLYETQVSEELCVTCHDASSLAKTTADCTILTDGNATVVNPHAIPQTDAHDANLSCMNCHKMHSDQTAEDRALKVCPKCHHENVFECGTCHVV